MSVTRRWLCYAWLGLLISGCAGSGVSLPAREGFSQPGVAGERRDALRDGGSGPLMVWLRGDVFTMGSPPTEADRNPDEERHSVAVEGFYIGKYEVTFAQYDRFAKATGRKLPDDAGWGRGERPVINVSWHDARAYSQWLSEQTGQHYRLPTEAQWEYAARAGTESRYWWGDAPAHYANCFGCGQDTVAGRPVPKGGEMTAPVGSFPANEFGLHDTAGNVWEWSCSAYETRYTGQESRCASAASAQKRVLRGGSWISAPHTLRSAFRAKSKPSSEYKAFGFRVVRLDS